MTLTARDEKSFQWVALSDLSDEEAKPTIFAVRFKLAETANAFKKIFDDCLNVRKNTSSQLSTAIESISRFWECQLCHICNEGSVIKYIACCNDHKINITSSKSGMNSQQSIAIETLEQQNAFFQQQVIALQNSKDELQKEVVLRITLKQLQQTHTSGSTDSVLALAAKNAECSEFSSGGFKGLTDPGKQLSSGNNNEPPEFTAEVKPTVRPPTDVKRPSNKQDDLVLFVHRAKLYRFDTFLKQWKERGIGNIKILAYKKRSKFSILMRWYPVLKVCCNHLIVKGMTLTARDEKSFQWVALSDLSDEEAKPTIFAVRFKLEETANTFKKIFDDCSNVGKNTSSQLSTAIESIPKFWECRLCRICNEGSVIKYIACCNDHKINITSSKSISGMNSQQSIAIESIPQASEATKLCQAQCVCNKDSVTKCTFCCNKTNNRSSNFNLSTQQLKSSPNSNILPTVRIPAVKEKEFSSGKTQLTLTVNNVNDFGGDSDGNKDFDGTRKLSSGNDSFQSTAEFRPIVKVSSDVKLQFGEEDELVLFPYKTKHYQFDTFSQRWKIGRKGELVI